MTLGRVASNEIKIPQETLDEVGICGDNGLEIYADEGEIIIREVEDSEE